MADLYEVKAAVLAARENTALPVFVTMTFEENLRTFSGVSPEAMAVLLDGLGIDALGVTARRARRACWASSKKYAALPFCP